MLISPKHKRIILRCRDPSVIEAVIPKAKRFDYNGKEFLAVKHGVDECKVLANLGIKAPSPIGYYYDWPGRFTPFAHQKEIAEFLTMNNRAFNLGDIGTGKSISTLWAYDYMRSIGLVNKVLIVSPLSTLERTWGDEIFHNFPHLTFSVIHGSADKRLKLLNTDADIYLINHDGVKVRGIVEALQHRDDINLIIVDEIAQVGRTAGTERFKALVKIINRQVPRMCWGLTGTPTPNAPTDAWAQCRLLVPDRVPPYFNRFKQEVMRQVTQFIWLPKSNALEVVQAAMQPAIRFHRDDCVDLPPCMYETRSVELTSQQKKAYKDMLSKLVAQADGGEITAVNEAVKAQKLLQIACGVAYGKDHEELYLDVEPRINVAHEIIEEAQTKVIVFVPFVSAVEMVTAELRKRGHTVARIYGDVHKAERDQIFADFMNCADPRVLVAQPATMSHGLTLTAASTIIWYAPITSADTYEQANGRIIRISQKHSQLIVNIEGTDMERKYYKRLAEKQKVQGLLLDAIRDVRLAGKNNLTMEVI